MRHIVTYYAIDESGALTATTGVVIVDHGDDILTLRIHLASGFDRTITEAPRCDAGAPVAGCWSTEAGGV